MWLWQWKASLSSEEHMRHMAPETGMLSF